MNYDVILNIKTMKCQCGSNVRINKMKVLLNLTQADYALTFSVLNMFTEIVT